jgi:hypothetical protein
MLFVYGLRSPCSSSRKRRDNSPLLKMMFLITVELVSRGFGELVRKEQGAIHDAYLFGDDWLCKANRGGLSWRNLSVVLA